MRKLLILLLLTGCSTHENYRLIELSSLTSPSVSVLEVWDTPYGWEYGGFIIERHVFSGSSLFGQLAGPASIAYAASEIDTGTTVTVKGETNVETQINSDVDNSGNHNHGHGDDGL